MALIDDIKSLGIKGIIFDMDGVLVDSEPAMFKASVAGLREYGVESVPDDFRPWIGTGEKSFLGNVMRKYGVEYCDEAKYTVYNIYVRDIEKEIIRFPRVPETVEFLYNEGFALGIASAADEIKVSANVRAAHLNPDWFKVILNSASVEKLKPDPDIFLKAASVMGVDPSHCLVVEDAKSGVRAAKAGGMYCLGITSSLSAETLKGEGADWTAGAMNVLAG